MHAIFPFVFFLLLYFVFFFAFSFHRDFSTIDRSRTFVLRVLHTALLYTVYYIVYRLVDGKLSRRSLLIFSYIFRTKKNKTHNQKRHNVSSICFCCDKHLSGIWCSWIGRCMPFTCSGRTSKRMHIRSNDCWKECGLWFGARFLCDATKLQYNGEKGFIWCATIALLWTSSFGMCAIISIILMPANGKCIQCKCAK